MTRLNRLLDEAEYFLERAGVALLKAGLAAFFWIMLGLILRACWELFMAGWNLFGLV